MAAMITRFDGDFQELADASDRAHALIMSRGSAVPSGELRHQCATDDHSLYTIGVWESGGSHPPPAIQPRIRSHAHQRRLSRARSSPDADRRSVMRTACTHMQDRHAWVVIIRI
jgi:hypothetical protein